MYPEIDFYDTNPELWHFRYINTVFVNGIMSGGGDVFMPDEPLTLTQAAFLLGRIDPELEIPFELSSDEICQVLWTDLFMLALDNVSDGDIEGYFGISTVNIIPVWVVENGVFTDIGPFDSAGIDMNPFLDLEISALVKEGEILALLNIINDQPLLRGAYIKGYSDGHVHLFIGGAERFYRYANSVPQNIIGDLRISLGEALGIKTLDEGLNGIVNRLTPEFTELRDVALLPNAEDLRIYDRTGGTLSVGELHDITVGSDIADFIIENGYVRAVIINGEADPQTVRVLISETGFPGYFHDTVSVRSDAPFTVWSNGAPFTYNPGEIFTASFYENTHLFSGSFPRVYIVPDVRGGRLEITSICRNWPDGGSPRYRGFLEINKEPDGRFLIINELPVEEYLYAVISNELIEFFGAEAAKVQAVLARSYVYNHLRTNLFHSFGANIDDTFITQVYNGFPESTASINAVNHTRGLMLSHSGSVFSGSFFSTSVGATANSGEAWADIQTRNFPGTTLPYLQSSLFYTGNHGDLRDELNAGAFFRNWNIPGFDAAFPWYRWNVEMTAEQLTNSINSSIGSLYAVNPVLIQTLQPDGNFRSRPIETIGELIDIEVVSRGEGGIIMSVMITGTEAKVIAKTEMVIRQLFVPACKNNEITITRRVGDPVTNFFILPSAFFVMDTDYEDGRIVNITFHGGGYGHGVGMSQNGARGMAMAGYNFNQILRRYYRDAVLVRMW